MRAIPIFDTNIFGHVQTGEITQSDWRKVMRHRPGLGWPLSLVTVLELLVDLDNVTEENFTAFRKRIDIAFRLANGRILEDPKFLICTRLLRIPAPPHLIPPSAAVLQMYMSVIRHPDLATSSSPERSKRNVIGHRVCVELTPQR